MPRARKNENLLMVAESEHDANMYYATRFIAPDPFIFFQVRGKKILLMSDLEVDRARKEADAHQVLSTSKLARDYMKRHHARPGYVDLICFFLQSKRIRQVTVPGNFPLECADSLRNKGVKLTCRPEPFFEQRLVKSPAEVRAIRTAIGKVEKAFDLAVKTLRKTVIKKGRLYLGGRPFTSEKLRSIINLRLLEQNCVAQHTIVACGKHAVDPHDEGSGPLFAHQPIIMDIFPRDAGSRYFADFTRTVVRGKASLKLKAVYEAVHEGQKIAFRMIREGVDASEVHTMIQSRFESLGFRTGIIKGRMQGFFHGTGHGLGLDIHELPRVGGVRDILKAGHVVTVEPGLYYEGVGGVRLEDVVVVTKTGCRNLTKYPKFLEI